MKQLILIIATGFIIMGCSSVTKGNYAAANKTYPPDIQPVKVVVPVVDPVPQNDPNKEEAQGSPANPVNNAKDINKSAIDKKIPAPVAVKRKVKSKQLKRLKPEVQAEAAKKPVSPPPYLIQAANTKAAQQPSTEMFINAVSVYDYMEGALYQIYCSPGYVTDIMLQKGETLTSTPAAGDTKGWILDVTSSGVGSDATVHIFIKPRYPDLQTNMIITTDRHIYHLEIQSLKKTYQAGVSWYYAKDRLTSIASRIQAVNEAAEEVVSSEVSIDSMNFNYKIIGKASWAPVRVFDDGQKTFIQFPESIRNNELPPLFIDSYGDKQLVNYRYQKGYYIVDRLFNKALLQLGVKNAEKVYIVKKGSSEDKKDTNTWSSAGSNSFWSN